MQVINEAPAFERSWGSARHARSAALTGLASGAAARATPGGGGSELRYFVAGESGPHLVCVNALGQDLLVFSRLVEQLARNHRVVAWKPRGTFEPERPVTTLWDQVSDLRRILDAESVRDCTLVSWCSGAKVAIESARRAPEVRAIVLTNGTFKTYPGLEHVETEFEQTLLELCKIVVESPQLAPMVMDSMRSLLGGGAARFASRTDGSSATREDLTLAALIVEPFQSPDTTLRYARQVVDYLTHDISPAIAAVDQPVLVVSGENDRVSSPVMARAIAAKLPRGSFAEIAGGSHYCLYENASEVIPIVESFVSRHRP